MDEMLYILAIIAWVAFSFYQNYRKKTQARQKADEASRPVNMPHEEESMEYEDFGQDASDVLGEIFGFPVKQKPNPSHQTYAPDNSMQVDEIKPKSMIENMKKPYDSIEYQPNKIVYVSHLVEEEEPDSRFNAAEFDLENAFLFSIILDRPYK